MTRSAGQPLLSICIPTFGRARYAEAQARSALGLYAGAGDVEVVVVNNRSPDDTSERLAHIDSPALRIIDTAEHYDTAEENVMRSLPHLGGEYVWFLGDDEVLNARAVDFVLETLRAGDLDLMIFNSSTISVGGGLLQKQPVSMRSDRLEATVDRILESIGLLYTFAGISNSIHRRDRLSVEEGLKWLSRTKIYSHVGWFADSHATSRTAFFNRPLVFYRQNDYSDGHWDRVAEREGLQDLHFWSLGIARLLQSLVDKGCFSHVQAASILEFNAEARQYRLIDDLVRKIHDQIMLWVETRSPRQAFSRSEILEMKRFCLAADPLLFDQLTLIDSAHETLAGLTDPGDLRAAAAEFEHRFLKLHAEAVADGPFKGRYVGSVHGYDLYSMPTEYVGLDVDQPALRDEILATINPTPDGVEVIVANSYEDVVQAAASARQARLKRLRWSIDRRSFEPAPALTSGVPQVAAAATRPQAMPTGSTLEDRMMRISKALLADRSPAASDLRVLRELLSSPSSAELIEHLFSDQLVSSVAPVPGRATKAALLHDLRVVAGLEIAPDTLVVSPALSVQRVTPDGQTSMFRPGNPGGGSWRLSTGTLGSDAAQIFLPALEDVVSGEHAIELSNVYLVERPERHRPFRWTGPTNTTVVRLPVLVRTAATLVFDLAQVGVARPEEFSLRVNGSILQPRVGRSDDGLARITATLDPDEVEHGPLEIELVTPQVFPPGGDDPRMLGVAIASLTLKLTR